MTVYYKKPCKCGELMRVIENAGVAGRGLTHTAFCDFCKTWFDVCVIKEQDEAVKQQQM